jgi:hypothetical protein
MKDAACHERDVGLFFPATSEMPKAECLEYALTHNESNGVWGGLFAVQRRRLRVQRRREEKKSA